MYATTVNDDWNIKTILIESLSDENSIELFALKSDDKENEVYNYVINVMGLNSAAASGIMANIYSESSFNPNAVGDNGTSYGICQLHNERWTRLKNYCNNNGYSYTTLDGQLHYLEYELKTYYASVWNYLKSVSNDITGAYNAGYYWCYNFEIPANKESVSITRGNLAKNKYWSVYGNSDNIRYSIDESYTNTSTGFHTSGWVIAESDINKLTYSINGGSEKIYSNWLSRPDVNNAYPNYPKTPCGFNINLGWNNFIPGKNTFVIKAYTNNGKCEIISNIYFTYNDTEPPKISSQNIKDLNKDGYTAYATITDNAAVTEVLFPTKLGNGEWKWLTPTKREGDIYYCRIDISKWNNAEGNYTTHIYAYDAQRNVKGVSCCESQFIDRTPPKISNVNVIKDETGYNVTCTVMDNKRVNRVQFPTWTTANDQDDIIKDWITNPKASGIKNGDKYTYRVKYSDHKDERGFYNTHIYAYDDYGNISAASANGGNYYKYTIRYNANEGQGAPGNQIKVYKVNINLSNTKPSRLGYSFIGWATSKDAKNAEFQPGGIYKENPNITLYGNSDVTLYAVWKKNPANYIVSYNANGGTAAPENQTKTENVNLTLSSTKPIRAGYSFIGWNTSKDAASASYQPGGKYTANSNATLYAIWKKNPANYTVSYNANGGTAAPENQTKTENVNLTLSSIKPIRAGYSFVGWNTSKDAASASYQPGSIYTKDSNTILYAIWKKVDNGITLAVESATGISGKYVDIPIKIKNNIGISCFNVAVVYDNSIMYPVSYTKGSKFSDILSTLDSEIDLTNLKEVKFVWDSLDTIDTDCELFTVKFKIKENIASGKYKVSINTSNTMFADINLNDIKYTAVLGDINISDILKGDVNNDGTVNGKDIVLIRQYISGWSNVILTPEQIMIGDVTGDGLVNGKDVVKIRQYVAGWSGIVL